MSESVIRRIVNDAFEETTLHCDTNLYNDEGFRSFFAEIKHLLNECFHSLYDTVQREYRDPVERKLRFSRGLAFISSTDNERLSKDEISRAKKAYPDISIQYYRAMVRFAQCIQPGRESSTKIQVPSFESFLFNLYRRVATSIEICSARYFTTMSYLEQEIFLKDIMRITMSASLYQRKVDQENTPATTTTSAITDTSCKQRSILPSDSVSNIIPQTSNNNRRRGRAHTTTETSSSVLNGALSAILNMNKKDQETERDHQSLTELSLRRHKTSYGSSSGNNKVRTFPFTSQSVLRTKNNGDDNKEDKKAALSQNIREIDMDENNELNNNNNNVVGTSNTQLDTTKKSVLQFFPSVINDNEEDDDNEEDEDDDDDDDVN